MKIKYLMIGLLATVLPATAVMAQVPLRAITTTSTASPSGGTVAAAVSSKTVAHCPSLKSVKIGTKSLTVYASEFTTKTNKNIARVSVTNNTNPKTYNARTYRGDNGSLTVYFAKPIGKVNDNMTVQVTHLACESGIPLTISGQISK